MWSAWQSIFASTDDLRVTEATEKLADPACPDDRSEKYLQYIDASFERVKAMNSNGAEEIEGRFLPQARQVEAILSDQEKFANAPPVEENIVVDEVVDEAAHVLPQEAKQELQGRS